MIFLTTKKFGEGYDGEYDPRYPGYFAANFIIKGEQKQIRNLKALDLEMLIEQIDDCIKVHDFNEKSIHYLIANNGELIEIDEAAFITIYPNCYNRFLKLQYLNF